MTPARRPGPVLLVGALVAVAVLTAALAGPWRFEHRAMPDVTAPVVTFPPQSPAPQPSGTAASRELMPISQERWIYLVILTLLGLVAAVVLGLVFRRLAQKLRERRAGRDVDAADPDIGLDGDVVDDLATAALRAGARQAAQVLEREVPPGDAVIAAWVALESSAERSGIQRDRAQTATEFTLDLLRGTDVDGEAVQELLDLYLAARYSQHRLTAADVARARSSLATIAEGLGS